MTPDLVQRLAAVRARLGRKPYDAPALCEELVLQAALGRHEPARAAFERLLPFLGASEATALLDDLTAGRSAVHASEQAYWLDELPPPELATTAEACLLAIAEELAEPPPRVVFRVERARRVTPHAVRVVNGFGLVVLHAEAADEANAQASLLAHEIAHTALACGQLFLDEGLATYFERRAEARDPLAADPDPDLPPVATLLGPDLGRLLCRAPSESYIQRIYDHGARLFAWLLAHRREARLGPFFSQAILGRSHGNLPAALEQYFALELEELETALLEPCR